METSQRMLDQLREISERQRESAERTEYAMAEMIKLLQEGFRLSGK